MLSNISKQNVYFDAIFLDIKMSQMSGMDTAKEIRKVDKKTNIIFVTAFKEFVFDAFEVNAVNYFVKPVESQKIYNTLEKLVTSVFLIDDQFLIIHKSGEIKKILFTDILYCEIVNHRGFVYERNKTHEYRYKIGDLEKKLTADFFPLPQKLYSKF